MSFLLDDYLIVKGISLRKRVSDLFNELEKNPELAEVFIRNPILVLQSKVLPEFAVLAEEEINAANQFLFSVLSNDKFMKWLENYQTKLVDQYNKTGKLPNKKKLLQQFTKGLIESGDPKILSDILEISPKNISSEKPTPTLVAVHDVTVVAYLLIRLNFIAVSRYILILWTWLIGPNELRLLDENQKIVTISPRELKSLAEQIVKYAKKMRAQEEESAVEE